MSASTVACGDYLTTSKSPRHREALQHLFARVSELSSFPGVAQRVLRVTDDEDAGADDLVRVVEQDPMLVIRILRTVNSPYCGLQSEVADLRSAVAILGFSKVRSLALTVYVARLMDQPDEYLGYSRTNLWRHLVSVGEAARVISRVCMRANPDEAYLTGLLHDLGYFLADQYMQPSWRRVLQQIDAGAVPDEAERDVLTFTCSDLSAYMAANSLLPERICSAIAYHKKPEAFLGRDRELLNVLAAANYIAESRGLTAIGRHSVDFLDDDVLRGLGIREGKMDELMQELAPALEAAEALVEI
ncbi:MAG: hypothetical protein CMJ58_05595 [Planctomycetaceae bacterium]|nr:hypothetical protein [Planctomycetaceae bacterium]